MSSVLTQVTETMVVSLGPSILDYLDLICSIGGLAIVLYILGFCLVKYSTQNSLKTKLLKELYMTAPQEQHTENEPKFDLELGIKNVEQRRPLTFGFFSNCIYNLFGLRSKYRSYAIKQLEKDLDIVGVINENRKMKNVIRVLLTEKQQLLLTEQLCNTIPCSMDIKSG